MKIYTITFVASALSGIALICSLVAMAQVYTNVQTFWAELDQEISAFRSETDSMWTDLMAIGSTRNRREAYMEAAADSYGQPETFSPPVAPVQQGVQPSSPAHQFALPPSGPEPSGACSCNADNKCRHGPPGPKGVTGAPGPNGYPGQDGKDGKAAQDVEPASQDTGTCFYCAPGPPGGPGPMGRPGPRGMKGADGALGRPGQDGNPGHPGELGAAGPNGKDGPEGRTGEKGMDGRKPIGRPGPKGRHGEQGDVGPQGAPGADGPQGAPGDTGIGGPQGGQGPKGLDGPPGGEGKLGRPGHDAEYCPCPPRKAGGVASPSGGDSYVTGK